MAVVRTLENGNKVTDWSQEINEIDNQYGLINGMGIFNEFNITQESVVFEKDYRSSTLIPQTSRRGKPASKGRGRKSEVFSLALPYFSTEDVITPSDIQGHRRVGTENAPESFANVLSQKMEDMRLNIDQTVEYMKLNAIKGITIDPDGNVIANMFSEFSLNVADFQVNWTLSNDSTDVDGLIRVLKRTVAKNAKLGGAIGGVFVLCSPGFFDALVKHPKIREAYLQYEVSNPRSDVVRGNLTTFEAWGTTDIFEHKGIVFMSYDSEFTQPDGTVVPGITDLHAHVMVTGTRDLYRAYYGPANTLSGANSPGSKMFMYQYRDPKDKYYEIEAEMSPLFFCTRPQTCVDITAN